MMREGEHLEQTNGARLPSETETDPNQHLEQVRCCTLSIHGLRLRVDRDWIRKITRKS